MSSIFYRAHFDKYLPKYIKKSKKIIPKVISKQEVIYFLLKNVFKLKTVFLK